MTDTPDLHLQWSDADDSSYVNDLAGSAEQVGDDPHEPCDTLALACTAAIVSDGVGNALEHQWGLYTPQHAAVTASALHATLKSSAENLRALRTVVEQMAVRGDVDMPEPSGLISTEDENLADALNRLTRTADDLEAQLPTLLPAIHTLNQTRGNWEPAPDVHTNLVAVASLLGEKAKLVTPVDGHHSDATEYGCGCVIHVFYRDELYYLDYADLGWSVVRDSAGTLHEDGSRSWSNTPSLGVQERLAHPAQIADAAIATIAADAETGSG